MSTFELPETEIGLRFDIPESVGMSKVSIAIVDPDRQRLKEVTALLSGGRTGAVRGIPGYLPTVQKAPWLAEQGFDMILVGLDSNARDALRTVESLCALSPASVVVYSQRSDQELLLHAMRSGARELLTYPFSPGAIHEAIARVAARLQTTPNPKKATGKILIFMGSKGGAGVTTVACNFAVALAQEAKKNILFIDFDLPLGDAGLNLGLKADYSTVDALREAVRLDPTFLSRLLVKHSSGLSVLPAPGQFPHFVIEDDAANRLLAVASNSFDYVVIDVGSRHDWTRTHLFDLASRIYLVTQVGVPELRNANRMIMSSIAAYASKLEIVVSRYAAKSMGIDDDAIERALTREPQWRVPNNYFAVREMQNRAEPLALANSPIARVIRKMAREVCGAPDEEKKCLMGIFR
ncbi:MAG: AAA family ATPase [Terracidiphilus sp.]